MSPEIANFTPALFWDVDREAVDVHANKRWLIARVLGYGRLMDWKTLRMLYSLAEIVGNRPILAVTRRENSVFPVRGGTGFQGIIPMLHFEAIEPRHFGTPDSNFRAIPLLSDSGLWAEPRWPCNWAHRKSEDLDLFGSLGVMGGELEQRLRKHGDVELVNRSKVVETYFVRGVKVDFVNYPYAWQADPVCIDGLTLASSQDIGPMKLEAITNRGSKKDFIDLAFLLETFTLSDMLALYAAKYPQGSGYLVLRSMVYFDDAEDDPLPVMLKSLGWDEAKARICEAVRATA